MFQYNYSSHLLLSVQLLSVIYLFIVSYLFIYCQLFIYLLSVIYLFPLKEDLMFQYNYSSHLLLYVQLLLVIERGFNTPI